MWETRERKALEAINRLLMAIFRDQLQGGCLPNLRKAISFAVPATKHAKIKASLGVTLFAPSGK